PEVTCLSVTNDRCGRLKRSESSMGGSPAVWEPRTIRSIGLLFDGDTLCQVAGLVDVSAFEHRGMVGKELDWNCVQQRGDERVAVGHGDVEGEAVGKPRNPRSV